MQVEIWSDIACPWCYIGKRRFERALGAFEHRDEVNVIWRAFELDPGAPAERPGSHAEMLARKYGRSVEQAQESLGEITALAAEEGLDFRFDRIRAGSTFDAHRLVHLGAVHGRQDAAKERLMRAYFGEGELMSDHATLQRLGEEAGLPADEVRELLATERYAEEVRDEERLAHGFGIGSVPFFVVERKYGGAGAQPVEVFAGLLAEAWTKTAGAA